MGVHRALVVHGLDGLDEITITGPTRIAEVREGNVRTYEVTPEEFGINRAALEGNFGGDAAANAAIIRDILAGKKSPRRDIVLLNAAAALVAAGRAEHLADGLPLAAQSIDSGAASGSWRIGEVYNHSHVGPAGLRASDLNTSVPPRCPDVHGPSQEDSPAASLFNLSICSR